MECENREEDLKQELKEILGKTVKTSEDWDNIYSILDEISSLRNDSYDINLSIDDIDNTSFGIEQYLQNVDALSPELAIALGTMQLHGKGPFEGAGNIIGGWAGATLGAAVGAIGAVEGGPFWLGIAGGYVGQEMGGNAGEWIDEKFGTQPIRLW